jgi:GAF domain-containing protein
VVQAVASALDLPQVLKRVLDLAIEATGADAGAIALVDPESDRVSYPYLRGLPESLAQTPSPRGAGLAWRLIETRKPILMHKYAHHPSALPDWVEAGVRAFLGVPLIAGDEAIGALALFMKEKDRSFPDEEVERAQAIATMAAIAVQNARLLDQATRRAEEAQGLIQTARSISASLDQETVLNLIAEKARELLQADGSRVHLHDPESGLLRCVIALDEPAEGLKAMALKPGEGLVGYVMNSGEPLLTNNPAADPRAITVPGTPTEEPEALMLAPLNVRQRTMGVMTVRRVGNRRPFRSSEMDLQRLRRPGRGRFGERPPLRSDRLPGPAARDGGGRAHPGPGPLGGALPGTGGDRGGRHLPGRPAGALRLRQPGLRRHGGVFPG